MSVSGRLSPRFTSYIASGLIGSASRPSRPVRVRTARMGQWSGVTPERHHELSATLWDMDARAEVERVDVYPRGRTAGSHQFPFAWASVPGIS
jgi:hypothetical protein